MHIRDRYIDTTRSLADYVDWSIATRGRPPDAKYEHWIARGWGKPPPMPQPDDKEKP